MGCPSVTIGPLRITGNLKVFLIYVSKTVTYFAVLAYFQDGDEDIRVGARRYIVNDVSHGLMDKAPPLNF